MQRGLFPRQVGKLFNLPITESFYIGWPFKVARLKELLSYVLSDRPLATEVSLPFAELAAVSITTIPLELSHI